MVSSEDAEANRNKGTSHPGRWMWWSIWVFIAFYVVAFAVLAVMRLDYPYEIDSMEGGHVAMCARLTENQELYPPPSINYVPLDYTPLFFFAAQALGQLQKNEYFGIRGIAILGTLWTLLVILWVARRAQAPLWAIAVAIGTFLGYSSRCSFNLDAGRVDSFAVAFGITGLAVLFECKRALWVPVIAGILAALGFLTKQTMVVCIVIPALWLLLRKEWASALVFSGTALVTITGALAWWGMLTNSWFYYYVFKVQSTHHIGLARLFFFAPAYLLLTLPAGLLIGLLGNNEGKSGWKNVPGSWFQDPWAVILLMNIGMALLAKAKDGGGENVFIPVAALAAVQIGRHTGKYFQNKPKRTLALLLVQLLVLFYLPSLVWPTHADTVAGEKLVEKIRSIPGEVYVPAFPVYAVRAGKSWWGHYSPLCDIAQFDLSLRESLRTAIREKRFSAIAPRSDVEPQDIGLCDLPDLDQFYEPLEAIEMPARPSVADILLGRPSLAGLVHGGKFASIYIPRRD